LCNGVIIGAMLSWYEAGFGPAFPALFAVNGLSVAVGELIDATCWAACCCAPCPTSPFPADDPARPAVVCFKTNLTNFPPIVTTTKEQDQ
jgi:hypothetical protein